MYAHTSRREPHGSSRDVGPMGRTVLPPRLITFYSLFPFPHPPPFLPLFFFFSFFPFFFLFFFPFSFFVRHPIGPRYGALCRIMLLGRATGNFTCAGRASCFLPPFEHEYSVHILGEISGRPRYPPAGTGPGPQPVVWEPLAQLWENSDLGAWAMGICEKATPYSVMYPDGWASRHESTLAACLLTLDGPHQVLLRKLPFQCTQASMGVRRSYRQSNDTQI